MFPDTGFLMPKEPPSPNVGNRGSFLSEDLAVFNYSNKADGVIKWVEMSRDGYAREAECCTLNPGLHLLYV
ncbi:hypothetical protein ASD40_13640 [Paenibacillus sp. Root444D2]|nr:hypothetical protein ASD40_13640 [Paenibacillus sp. Root444D2]KRE48659.1 hypothetical protein ASG85_26190 [Paenibacillus sp. Soil724D2]